MIFRMIDACSREEKHDTRLLYALSIRDSHSADDYRLAGLIDKTLDLKLPLLAHFMTASKNTEDFTRQIEKQRRENVRSIIRLLRLWIR